MAGDDSPVGRSAHTPDATSDDRDKWMTLLTRLDDDELDALLAGTAPIDALAPVAEVVQRLRLSVILEPVPPMSSGLIAQLAEAPVVSLAARRAAQGSLVKAAAAAVAAVLALAGVGAAQNRLPSGIQDVVSSTAELVGIDVPRASERQDEGDGSPVTTTGGQGGNGGEPGYEGTTPGGATPADPGTPGDQEPATPATPPEGQGNQGGNGRNESTPNSTVPAGPQGGPNATGTDTSSAGDTATVTDQTTGSGQGKKG